MTQQPIHQELAQTLESYYRVYNCRGYVRTDPILFLYEYDTPADREIVGLIASSLAYGRVAQILASVRKVLKPMGASPADFLLNASPAKLRSTYSGFRHRFTGEDELVCLLLGIRRMVLDFGSLNRCFLNGYTAGEYVHALSAFTRSVLEKPGYLLPDPLRGSACKRLNLYMRWMVRRDDVDPGGWTGVPASELLFPMDTHILRISRYLKMTARKAADMKTVLEVTEAFKGISPGDPVKYDFTLTRIGMLGIKDTICLPD